MKTSPVKSAFFTIVKTDDINIGGPGIFPGNFTCRKGSGGEGCVLEGEIPGKRKNKKAAYKFVDVLSQQDKKSATEALKNMRDKLSEMITMQALEGSSIMPFLGHFR